MIVQAAISRSPIRMNSSPNSIPTSSSILPIVPIPVHLYLQRMTITAIRISQSTENSYRKWCDTWKWGHHTLSACWSYWRKHCKRSCTSCRKNTWIKLSLRISWRCSCIWFKAIPRIISSADNVLLLTSSITLKSVSWRRSCPFPWSDLIYLTQLSLIDRSIGRSSPTF